MSSDLIIAAVAGAAIPGLAVAVSIAIRSHLRRRRRGKHRILGHSEPGRFRVEGPFRGRR